MDPLFSLSHVSFSYRNVPILHDVSCSIPPHSFVGIVGRVGAGKTTLLYLLTGLIPHEIKGTLSGSVIIQGTPTHAWKFDDLIRRISFVMQDPTHQLFLPTVSEEVAFALRNFKQPRIDEAVRWALDSVGLREYASTHPHDLSSGQQKLLTIACGIARDVPVYVFDEPTANLDSCTASQVYALFQKLHAEGKTIIVAEHAMDLLSPVATHFIVLRNGTVVDSGGREILTKGYPEFSSCARTVDDDG